MDIQKIFAADREQHPPHERSLPWEETKGAITVVVEPKPHWAHDLRAFGGTPATIALMPIGPRTARVHGSTVTSACAATM
jgi:hypothetical protein